MTTEEAREKIDTAISEWVETLGIDPVDFDYSYINQDLDDIEYYLRRR
jgi:hypothetical protein